MHRWCTLVVVYIFLFSSDYTTMTQLIGRVVRQYKAAWILILSMSWLYGHWSVLAPSLYSSHNLPRGQHSQFLSSSTSITTGYRRLQGLIRTMNKTSNMNPDWALTLHVHPWVSSSHQPQSTHLDHDHIQRCFSDVVLSQCQHIHLVSVRSQFTFHCAFLGYLSWRLCCWERHQHGTLLALEEDWCWSSVGHCQWGSHMSQGCYDHHSHQPQGGHCHH